jgi:hypothetical protein
MVYSMRVRFAMKGRYKGMPSTGLYDVVRERGSEARDRSIETGVYFKAGD